MASPARQQYLEIKHRYPEAILMFRLGDFYEMFDEDAETASRILGIQLTARNYPRGEGRVPMAGVPHHSVHGYIKRLLDVGQRVAVCDQMTPPGKGIVQRDVVRVFTPGTVVEADMLQPKENSYLAAVAMGKEGYGLAYVDVSTGEFRGARLGTPAEVEVELLRLAPAEWVLSHEIENGRFSLAGAVRPRSPVDAKRAVHILISQFQTNSLSGFGLDEYPETAVAAAIIVEYVRYSNTFMLDRINSISLYSQERFMVLDRYSRASLELMPRAGEDRGRWTLLKVLDRTKTGMGGRRLRGMISQPLLDREAIESRLDQVQALVNEPMLTRRLSIGLQAVGDIERIMGRIVQGQSTASELHQLRLSLESAGSVRDELAQSLADVSSCASPISSIDCLPDLCTALAAAVDAESGPSIRDGYNPELDRLRGLVTGSRSAILALEAKEVLATGVKTLRIGFNKVFGYYFEVGKTAAKEMPNRFVRQQTLINAERFMTPELKELEVAITSAEDDSRQLERKLFDELRCLVRVRQTEVAATAQAIAEVDVLRSLADVALSNNYCRPTMDDSTTMRVVAGRHPVVEAADPGTQYVPNDCEFDDKSRIIVLTGPNMGGKSTMLRMVALISLMAQIGSYVPADEAVIGITDRIFSRVGAQDDIASGQSTFMTEMIETANILHNATRKSLLILDEIGRGTSTYDGLAIARAVIEFVHARIGARTLFATHYHELAVLEDELAQVANFHTEIAEHEGGVIFLHKILSGSADRSYGIHVARLVGLPHSVTVRADRLLRVLEKSANGAKPASSQLALFSDPDLALRSEIEESAVRILDAILALDLENMTPLSALEQLHRFQEEGRTSR